MHATSEAIENLFEQLCSVTVLQKAFKAVKDNKGAPGVDGQTIQKYEENLQDNLRQLIYQLENWTYQPRPVRAAQIPKPNGGTRTLGIPCVRDRIVQAALKHLLEPIFERTFSQNSYGFRPGRSQKHAVSAARYIVATGKEYVVDIDLKKFFDTIHHDRLISRITIQISDRRILRIIGMTLRSGIMIDGVVRATEEGSVQGSPLSPLLSNIVLDELDKELELRGLEFCRFADDCNIFVHSQKAADRVMESISKYIEKKLKLEVNKEKSKTGLSKAIKFLGMTIVGCMLIISTTSMARAMTKVKELTPRGTNMNLERTITKVNSWYVGWANYYNMTNYPSQLSKIEAHIRRRLRARIVSQQKTRRNLFNKLVQRGVPKRQATIAYSNRKKWAMSHTRAAERAYPNAWFENTMGLKTKSKEDHPHWMGRKQWIRVL